MQVDDIIEALFELCKLHEMKEGENNEILITDGVTDIESESGNFTVKSIQR